MCSLRAAYIVHVVVVASYTSGRPSFTPVCMQVDYLAKRLSSLLVLPDSRQALMRLPEPLLRQLLTCEAVDVEQVRPLLQPLTEGLMQLVS